MCFCCVCLFLCLFIDLAFFFFVVVVGSWEKVPVQMKTAIMFFMCFLEKEEMENSFSVIVLNSSIFCLTINWLDGSFVF